MQIVWRRSSLRITIGEVTSDSCKVIFLWPPRKLDILKTRSNENGVFSVLAFTCGVYPTMEEN